MIRQEILLLLGCWHLPYVLETIRKYEMSATFKPLTIVARKRQKDLLNKVIQSPKPELVVVYGRRRVGKTYLIRNQILSLKTEPNSNLTYLEILGQKNERGDYQKPHDIIVNFKTSAQIHLGQNPNIGSIPEIFNFLIHWVRNKSQQKKKVVIFF